MSIHNDLVLHGIYAHQSSYQTHIYFPPRYGCGFLTGYEYMRDYFSENVMKQVKGAMRENLTVLVHYHDPIKKISRDFIMIP